MKVFIYDKFSRLKSFKIPNFSENYNMARQCDQLLFDTKTYCFSHNTLIFQDGMPALNIQPLDPYVVDEREVNLKRGPDATATGSIRNLRIFGLTETKVLDVK